jgi:hypothetical protein
VITASEQDYPPMRLWHRVYLSGASGVLLISLRTDEVDE